MNNQNETLSKNRRIEKKFQNFGAEFIAGYPGLNQLSGFPDELWRKMADRNLFGIAVSTEFEGHGGSFGTLTNAGRALVEYGGNLGTAMSWLVHEMVANYLIMANGTDTQKAAYLPHLARGEKTASLAVSEPKTGAHPKHIRTRADKVPGGYCLNGEKTYLTNGPFADMFIVIAVTGQENGKNRFTAFIVPKDTPGLTVSDPIDFPFLRPSPHGGIVLADCVVKSEQVLGDIGGAYEKMVLPFRTVEDTLMMGPITGGLAYLLRRLIGLLKQNDLTPHESVIRQAAQLKCAIDVLAEIADIAAGEIEKGTDSDRLLSMVLYFRAQAGRCIEEIRQMMSNTGLTPDHETTYMLGDLSALMRIAETVSKIKCLKLGNSLFSD